MKRILLLVTLVSLPLFAINPFELPLMNGEPGAVYKTADHPGSIFVIENYFYNCPFCQRNASNVNALQERFKDDARVQILDIGIDRKVSLYEKWIANFKPNHPVLMDSKASIARQLRVTGYPTTVILDSNLNVIYRAMGEWSDEEFDTLVEKIEALLK